MFRPSVSCSPNNNNPSNDNSGLRSSKIQRNRCYKHKQPSHVEIISIKKLKKEAFRKLNFQMAHDQLAFVQRLAYAHDNHRVFMSSRSGDSPAPLTDSITSRVGSLTLERMSSDMLLDGAGAPCDSTKDNDEDICTSLYRMDGLGLVDELDDIELLLDGMCGISVCQDEFDRVLEFEELHHYDIHHLDAAIGDLF
ncbi:hypothetical protein BSLG_001010 [Batrachochytrium salamandrivorans]|nr:hypothetical protein BASA60_001599 [Batrachochytrium salamandrivorans]KAJ1330319.1 hypothetical protein BSLG_009455 [Batrachochytrium salamandrivorans]KAJ1344450.1 hypothetical protein BSLG_001010 [Batrachochytrium salamandrivorans]